MAAEIQEITGSNDVWPDQIYGYLQAMNAKLDQIIKHQARLDTEMTRLLGAWSTGGIRGLRKAANGG